MSISPPGRTACQRSRRMGRRVAVALLVAHLRLQVAAGSPLDTDMFSFNAFGTLGVVHSTEDRADFQADPLKPNGAGYTHAWSAAVDSLIAGQITATFTPRLSAVVQVLSQQRYDGTYRPQLRWANIKYQLTDDLSVRAGRMVWPTFLISDTRNVGYANTWVRTPGELYDLDPTAENNGVDARYSVRVGNVTNTVMAAFGTTNPNLPTGGTVDAKREWVLADNVEYGAMTVHLAYQSTLVDVDVLDDVLAGFRAFGPQGVALADKYTGRNKDIRYIGLGAQYDPGEWFLMGEWGRDETHSFFGTSSGWYVSSGWRLAKFTPYLTYAAVKPDSATFDPGLTVAAYPPSAAGIATELNAVLNTVLSRTAAQRALSVGTRWDFVKSVDLKVQYDHTWLGAGTPGTLTNVQPDFHLGGQYNLFSLAFDFVL